MKQLDIFADTEFQSLDLEKKQSITDNYFDKEMVDEEFFALDSNEQKRIKDNFRDAQIDFDISDTVDKVVNFVNPDKPYIETEEVSDPTSHNPVAPNIDGTMPKAIKSEPIKETTLLEDAKEIIFGNGEDYTNPNAKDYELGKRLVNRTNELTSNAIQGAYNFLGNIKSPIEYLGFETDAMKESNKARQKWFKEASDNLNEFVYKKNKLDVKPTHTWDEVKKSFSRGGVFDADAWQEVGNYILGEGVASLPDMAEMVAMMPLYYASRQQESAEKRAKNNGRVEPTKDDYLATAPTTMGSIILDKFSLNGITKDVVETVGKKALDGSMKDVVKVIGSEMKKGTLKEGVTEAIQNPLEKFGEELGTKNGLSSAGEYLDESLSGFVAGAGMGASMSGTTATGTQVFNEYSKQKQETQRDAYIQDAYNKQILGNGLVTTVNDAGFVEFKNQLNTKISTIQNEFENLVINNPEIDIPIEAVDNIEVQEQVVTNAKEKGLDVSNDNGLNAIDKGFKELEAEIGSIEDEILAPKASEKLIIEKPIVGEPKPEARVDLLSIWENNELTEEEKADLTKQGIEYNNKIDTKSLPPQEPETKLNNKDIIQDANNDTTLDNIPLQDKNELSLSQKEDTKTTEPKTGDTSFNPDKVDTARLKELQEKTEDDLTTDERFELEDLQEEVKQLQELGNDELLDTDKEVLKEISGVDDSLIVNAKNLYEDESPELQAENIKLYEADKNMVYTDSSGHSQIVTIAPVDTQKKHNNGFVGVVNQAGSSFGVKASHLSLIEDKKTTPIQEDSDVGDTVEDKKINEVEIVKKISESYVNKRIKDDTKYLDEVKEKYGENSSQYKNLKERQKQDQQGYKTWFTKTFEDIKNSFDNADMEQMHNKFVNGIGFESYKKALEGIRDIKFGKTKKASVEAINKYFNGKYSEYVESRKKKNDTEALQRKKLTLINSLENEKINFNSEPMSKKEFLDRIFADGFTNIKSAKRGATLRYSLSDGKSSYDIKKTDIQYIELLQEEAVQKDLDKEEADVKANPQDYLTQEESNHLFGNNKKISLVEAQTKKESDTINKEVQEDENANTSNSRDTEQTVSTVSNGSSNTELGRTQRGATRAAYSQSQRDGTTQVSTSTSQTGNTDDGGNDTERLSTTRSSRSSDKRIHSPVQELDNLDNFEIEDELGEGGLKTKFKNNISAIEIVLKIQKENYKPTQAEKKVLSKYVGWGGIPNAFIRPDGTIAKGWEKEAKSLKELLTDEQYNEARRSTQDAHYTSKEIVDAIWAGVKHLGFKGGKVLEPSVGVGNFFGMMPSSYKSSTKLYGVELDGITSTIAKTLYPKATIQNKGFQDVELNNDFSLVIGNPPFGSQKLFDKNSKHLKDMSIHNYFFAKGIDALEEGGILAMVVSNGLMDAGNTKAREYIGSKANLLGAIRLPNNAFSKNANTEVTTDIIFLQKRYKSQESNIDQWRDIGMFNNTPINEYFVNNEKMMLGKWGKYGTMYRGDSPALIKWDGSPNTPTMLLPDAIKSLPKSVITHETIIKQDNSEATFSGDIEKVRVGAMYVSDGVIYKRLADKDGEVQASEVNTKLNSKGEEVAYTDNELKKIKTMIDVVSVADELRQLQLDTRATEPQLRKARASLNKVYDAFVKNYRFLNNPTNIRLFEDDIRSPFLQALEKHYDKGISSAVAKRTGQLVKKESAIKADIFFKRTQTPYIKPTKADNSQDALTISLSEYGVINFDYMQDLTGKSEDELISELDGFIFDDVNDGWVTKEEYLSGNVKQKFEQTDNLRYKEALKKVIPKDIEAMDISVTLGASWIPKNDMADFVEHITGDDNPTITLTTYNGKWGVTANTTSAKATQWGTPRRKADDILKQTMNLVQIQVKDNHGSSTQPQWVVNTDETTAVQEKQEQMKAEFKEWLWKSADRRERLSKIYNAEFNTKALREFNGSHIKFVGKSDTIDLRQHQKNGVWRVLQGGTTLFDHTVGTGKTFTAIASVMELRRTGKANKPLIVVPNHLTAQWGKEWMELYPNASILVPTKADFSAKKRKILMSKMATGDYDAIIIAHSQLTKIQNDVEFEANFIGDEIDRIQVAIDMLKAEDGKSRSVKDAEKAKERLEEKLKKMSDIDRDDNLDFSQLGVDAIVVDESHEFKNLSYQTGLQGVAGLGNPQGSKKAFDLFIKTQNILDKTAGNNIIFLTGTPISNTIAEMFTIQRYLNYKELQDKNLDIFDAWVKQYAEIVSDWELSPSGKYKLNTRLSKFNNMPELITEYKQFSDVVTREDIPALPIPLIKGGRAQNIVVDRSDAQAQYIGIEDKNGRYPAGSLVYRSEHMPKGKPKKGDDNMLKIMGEARKVALDMRLIDTNYADNPDSKVNLTVKNSYDIYRKWNAKKGTQLIFCDLSTPKGAVAKEKAKIEALIKKADEGDEKASEELDKMNPDDLDALNSSFSVYDDIKAKLIAKGVSENEIAFIHDANTELQKQELFAKVKSGSIRILLGSTSKMGAGMNVQDKLVALHHIDVPWRPSDLEQREGRIIRQGNEFFKADPKGFEVEIFRYATKNTLDSMMWQTIEAKANFIEQLRAGNLLDREVEDVSSEAVSAGEMKAMSSGNPLILEDMKLKKDIKKLEALKKGHDRGQYDLEAKIKKANTLINESESVLKAYTTDSVQAKKLPKKFVMSVNAKEYDNREEAGKELIHIVKALPLKTSKLVGEMGGFSIYIENLGKGLGINTTAIVSVSGVQDYEFDFNIEEQSYEGLTLKIANTIKKIPDNQQQYEIEVEYAKEQLPQLKEQISEFKKADELDAKRVRQREVLAQLRKKDDDKDTLSTEIVTDEDLKEIDTSYMKRPTKDFVVVGESNDITNLKIDIDLDENTRKLAGINDKPIVAYLHELIKKHPESFKNIKDVFKHIIDVKNNATFILQGSNPKNTLLIKKIDNLTKKIGIEKNNSEINLLVHALVSKKPNELKRLIKKQLERSPTLSLHNVDTANGANALLTAPIKTSISKKQQKNQDEINSYARANGYDEAGINYVPTYSVTGLPTRSDDGTIKLGEKVITLPTIDAPMNADSIRIYLKDIIGTRLYEGKIKAKSALGKYQRSDSAIRVKNYSDLEVMAHEAAHYLDYFYNNPTKKPTDSFFRAEIMKNKDEVKALSYTTNPKQVINEGFAEFVRLWLTNYNTLNLVAPNMVKDFEAKLSKDKMLQKKMITLQEGMHQYFYQGTHETLRAKQGGKLNTTAKKMQRKQTEIAKDIRQSVIDKLHSIKRIEADVKGDVSADALDSAYKSLQLVNGHSSVMYSAMNIGVPTVSVDGDLSYSGKPLNDIFAPVTKVSENRVRLFADYLVAKRASELMEQGRENLITADEIEKGLELADIYPEFETIFKEYQEFNDGMLDFYVDMNLITSEQKENFQEFNKNYVPFHRITESVQYGEVSASKIGKRLTGGTHSLGDIMENIITGIESNIKEALISRGKSVFYEMLESSSMGGVYATKVNVEDKLVKTDIAQQAKKVAFIMSELGVTVTKDGMILSGNIASDTIVDIKEIEENLLSNPHTLEFWTHGHKPESNSAYIDSAIINDKVVYFEVNDKGLVDSMTSFSGANYNDLVKGLMFIKNVMTWNITNNPLFYFTNFVRDTMSATVLSKNNFKPVLSSLAGAYHFITKSKTYKEFMASGAGYGTRRTSLGGDIQAMAMLDVNRGFEVLSRVISAMEYGADIFEYGTRIGDFALAKKNGKSNMQASFEAREVSTDFAIKGSNTAWTGFLATVPFMKAGINSIDKTARRIFSLNGEMKFSNAVKFKNQLGELQKHKIKIYAIGGMLAGLSLALWFSNKDDERYKKLTRDSKMMYWHFFIGENHIKIPRPYDIGFVFASIPEIIADGIYTEQGEEAAKAFMFGIKTMFSVGDVSGLFQPVLDHMTNTSWTGAPIVPHYMQNLDDLSDQSLSYTPLLYKEFGKATGASPILTQHYVDGYLGLTAKMIEEVTEKMLWNTKEWGAKPFEKNTIEFLTYRFKGKEQDTRTKYSEKYYELMEKANGVKASFDIKKKKAYVDGGEDVKKYMSQQEKGAYVQISKMLSRYNRTLTKIKNGVEMITYDKSLSKLQKEKLINEAYEAKTNAFKEITETLEKQLELFEGK